MLKCLGCDQNIPWDGQGTFCYTCPCGATVFYQAEPVTLMIPMSLNRYLLFLHKGLKGAPTPTLGHVDSFVGPAIGHIDRYVGTSPHSSELKRMFVGFLEYVGLVWMRDCQQCQEDGTLKREQEREAHLAVEEAERIMAGRSQGGEK